MPFSITIIAAVLVYVWLLEGHVPDDVVFVPGGLVVALTIWHDLRSDSAQASSRSRRSAPREGGHREWGFSWKALAPGFRLVLAVTLPLALLILGIGAAIGTLHDRRDFLGHLAGLFVWGGAQQWVLQTVVLREAQRATSRRAGIIVAALLFGAIHLPNPFLAPMTAGGALLWGWIYDRYPNIIPLALSHALGTLAILYAFDESITGRLRIGASYLRLHD